MTLLWFLLFASLWALPVQAWEGKQDNKGSEQLARLSDQALCQEAVAVCTTAAAPSAGMGMEAVEYLGSMRQVVQKQGEAAVPAWLTEASTAITTHEPQRCPTAACSQLSAQPHEERVLTPSEPASP
jgi:hypothetical protein